jgi:hypothetical protein
MILGLFMVILGIVLSLAPWAIGLKVVERMIFEIKVVLTFSGVIIFSVGCVLLFGNLSYE